MDVVTIKEIQARVDRLLFALDYQLEPDQYIASYKYIMDSLEFVEFAMVCEREFRISIPDEKLAEVISINGLVDLINNILNPSLTITPSK
jgi:acyl carrier protein